MSFLKKVGRTFAVALSLCIPFTAVACKDDEPVETVVTPTYIETPKAPTYAEISKDVLDTEYKTYYFDALDGDDENSGLNMDMPKKSLSEIAEIISGNTENAPIRILLKRGTTFYENLKLTGYTVTAEMPFILDAYGAGDEYPVICGTGTSSESDSELNKANVLHLEEDNTRIMNIEITGSDCTRGIYIFPRKGGVFENIVVDGCYVHNVNWNWTYNTEPNETDPDDIDPQTVTPADANNKDVGVAHRYRRLYGGICIFTGDLTNSVGAPVTFRNMWITDNRVEEVSHLGINFYNYWVNRPGVGYGYNKYVDDTTDHNDYNTGVGYFPMENIVVARNYTNCIGGDGIVVAGADNVWLEYNTCYKANYLGRSDFWNGGVWVHNVRTCYYQYNEAGYTYLRHGASDGEGFDIDNTCEDVYMQYNYGHHNEGGGMLLCNQATAMLKFGADGAPATERLESYLGNWKNNYVRNNVFVNNGYPFGDKEDGNHHSAFVTVARTVNDVVFENNTVVIRGDIYNQHIIDCEDNMVASGHVYRNNIFYCVDASSEPVFDLGTIKDPVFENNLYYNVKNGDELYSELNFSADSKAILDINPQIELPADGNYRGWEKAFLFTAKNDVVYSKGMPIATMMKYDIKGNDATKNLYLGAFAKKD